MEGGLATGAVTLGANQTAGGARARQALDHPSRRRAQGGLRAKALLAVLGNKATKPSTLVTPWMKLDFIFKSSSPRNVSGGGEGGGEVSCTCHPPSQLLFLWSSTWPDLTISMISASERSVYLPPFFFSKGTKASASFSLASASRSSASALILRLGCAIKS